MNPFINQVAWGLFAGFLIFSGTSIGGEVYKWVDTDGGTHYSEMPPESDLASVELLELEVVEPAPPVSASYQSILEVANSLEASRLERERLRLEKTRLRQREEEARRPNLVQNEVYGGPFVARYYYPPRVRHYRKHDYGGKHSRPESGPWHAKGHGLPALNDRSGLHLPRYATQK